MTLVAIIDDRLTNRNIYAKLAVAVAPAIQVRTFGDPKEALEALTQCSPDLVITDFKMPHMNGAEFTRRFRGTLAGQDVPIIVITAYGDRSYRLQALEAGATDFLQSPVDHPEFVTRARNLLKLREQQQLIKSRADELQRELQDSERSRQRLLRDSRDALAQVIDTVPALISATDQNGNCVFVNSYHAAMAGASPAALVGHGGPSLFGEEREERSRLLDQLIFKTGKALPSYEEEVLCKDGVSRILLTSKAPLRNSFNQIVSVLTTSLDITDRKRAERDLQQMAHHDALTGLPNRVQLRKKLQQLITDSGRDGWGFALHFLDLDRFKSINDVLGHHWGDILLKKIAGRLASAVSRHDIVARIGGDEFAIVQSGVSSRDEASVLAAKLIDLTSEPALCNGQHVAVSCSIGITFHDAKSTYDADALLREADLAMYQAKAEGRNTYRFFVPDMNERARRKRLLDHDLRNGLKHAEFVLHYQPQVNLRTGRIVGAEALIRWRRSGSGLLKPGDFLPAAEENGLIVDIDGWALREACAQAATWQHAGLPPVRIAVNVSPIHFLARDVRRLVTEVLNETGLDPTLLELELTEGVLMENAEAVAGTLRDLKEIGVRSSIDDFGKGYSSLNYLKSLPVSRLKIDHSFVRELKTESSDAAIIRTIISLSRSLALDVIAEGVETAEQLAFLIREGCDEIQGYYFSQPLPALEFQALVDGDKTLLHRA